MKLNELQEFIRVDHLVYDVAMDYLKGIGAEINLSRGNLDINARATERHAEELANYLAAQFGGEVKKKTQNKAHNYKILVIGTVIAEIRTSRTYLYGTVRVLPRAVNNSKVERRILRALKQRGHNPL